MLDPIVGCRGKTEVQRFQIAHPLQLLDALFCHDTVSDKTGIRSGQVFREQFAPRDFDVKVLLQTEDDVQKIDRLGRQIAKILAAGVGASLGFWRQDFDDLRGKSHGYVFDLFQIVENSTSGPLLALKDEIKEIKGMIKTGANVKAGSSFNIGFWFNDYDKSDSRSGRRACR